MEAAGKIPMSPVTAVGPTLVTDGVAARIPKLHAVPSEKTAGGGGHAAPVVNVHTKLAARRLPNVSAAPVVMVAVNAVFKARALEGANVAILVAAA